MTVSWRRHRDVCFGIKQKKNQTEVVRIEDRILSPTAINTYLSCPRKFYLRYIKKLRTRPSIHLIRGQIVHQTLHQFHKNHPQISQGNTHWQDYERAFNHIQRAVGKSQRQIGLP